MNETIFNRLINYIQQKGIIINDIKRLEKYITKYNYNRVMKPYTKLLNKEQFTELNITTDDLLNLYELDTKISLVLLDAILEIEKRLNTDIAYTIEDTYKIYDGCLFALDRDFVKNQIFSNVTGQLCNMTFEQLISKMTKYAHVNPNTNMYENVSRNNLFLKWKNCPLDALCLTWTFSTTVLSYFALNDHLKKKIIRHFKVKTNDSKIFDLLINYILNLRNQITHNNILFLNLVNINNDLLWIYNSLFDKRKQSIDLFDLATILEYLSGSTTILSKLKEITTKYVFSTNKLNQIVNEFFLGVKHER